RRGGRALLPVRPGRRPAGVQLRLGVQLLPAGVSPTRAGDRDLPVVRRALRLDGRVSSAASPRSPIAGPSWERGRRPPRAVRGPRLRRSVAVTPTTDTDRLHLARAIELAERGRGRVSPNPLVGAVIVQRGEVVAEGWHDAYGGPHAEVAAIRAAGERDLS